MKRSLTFCLISTLLAIAFSACEAEFSPNAEWKEIPVVYCLLDQDDDTTWVRVERCFLGEGDMHDYGTISDSINYPVGSIRVVLYALYDGVRVDSLVCRDTLVDRSGGQFAYVAQPLYFTTDSLREDRSYELVVSRTATGQTLAYTDPVSLIGWYDAEGASPITKPTYTQGFGFYERSGSIPVCKINWHRLSNARLYQPVVRFYYGEQGDTHYVDLRCSSVSATSNSSSQLSIDYSLWSFLSELETLLRDDTLPKAYLYKADIFLTACTEDLNVYLNSLNITTDIDQGREAYTNIHNGIGIFAARRTHLCKRLAADDSMNPLGTPAPGLLAYLKSRNIGF